MRKPDASFHSPFVQGRSDTMKPIIKPVLLTFDIFGTVVDWRLGMRQSLMRYGVELSDEAFEHIIDAQARAQAKEFKLYREITAMSLVEVLDLDPQVAQAIGLEVGHWPLFPDVRVAMAQLMKRAPCVAMTNSDLVHGQHMQEQLGYRLSDWVCAEEAGLYKPHPGFWRFVAQRQGMDVDHFPQGWWHVSAYADFDLIPASEAGLLTVFVRRDHCRPAASHLEVADLQQLVTEIDQCTSQ